MLPFGGNRGGPPGIGGAGGGKPSSSSMSSNFGSRTIKPGARPSQIDVKAGSEITDQAHQVQVASVMGSSSP